LQVCHASLLRNLKPVSCTSTLPRDSHLNACCCRLAVCVTRERGRCGGRVGSEQLLAQQRLGAAWHRAQLLPACPTAPVISPTAASTAVRVGPRYQSRVMGVMKDHHQPALVVTGLVGCFLGGFFACFFHFSPLQYTLTTKAHVQGGILGCCFVFFLSSSFFFFYIVCLERTSFFAVAEIVF